MASATEQITRAEMRKKNLENVEREQQKEEAQWKISEHHLRSLNSTFDEVHVEYHDLDGLHWSQSDTRLNSCVRRRTPSSPQPSSPSLRRSPHSPRQRRISSPASSRAIGGKPPLPPRSARRSLIPGLPKGSTSPLFASLTNLDLVKGWSPSSPRQEGEKMLPSDHRNGTRQRSPVKGVFDAYSFPEPPKSPTLQPRHGENFDGTVRPRARPVSASVVPHGVRPFPGPSALSPTARGRTRARLPFGHPSKKSETAEPSSAATDDALATPRSCDWDEGDSSSTIVVPERVESTAEPSRNDDGRGNILDKLLLDMDGQATIKPSQVTVVSGVGLGLL